MIAVFKLIVLCACVIKSSTEARSIPDTYEEERNNLLNEESENSVGGRIKLNEDELAANEVLMHLKTKELNDAYENPSLFNYTSGFLNFKKNIQRSRIYHIIKEMPKGAVLHVHTSMMLDPEGLLELTYEDNLYACYSLDDLSIVFSEKTPKKICAGKWKLLSDLRESTDNLSDFRANLRKFFTIEGNYDEYNEKEMWEFFEQRFGVVNALSKFRPVREKYLYKSLQRFYDDNIRYIELRGSLGSIYELNGTVHDDLYSARLHERIIKQFMQDHPDFIGAKWIVTIHRQQSEKDLQKAIESAIAVQAQLPDFIIGFDLVGREELGQPLKYYLPILKGYRNQINYYFHSGETDWNGMDVDENLIDAILLGTKRIAHGNALIKHPSLLAIVKRKDIAIEVNPISNSVLGLAKDLRTHPLATYISLNLPVVISSDDPGLWNADPVSHDYFVTFMIIASKKADLRLLKQLVLNSMKYSALDDKGKTKMLNQFNASWNKFINNLSKIDPDCKTENLDKEKCKIA